MAVAQFAQHVGHHLKLLCVGHVVFESGRVACVHLVPVESDGLPFVVEETIVLVEDAPERLEIARRRVGIFVFVDTGCEQRRQGHEQHGEGRKVLRERAMLHGTISVILKCLTNPITRAWV